jgi:hypothetical protein
VQLLSALCFLIYIAITTVIGSRLLWVGLKSSRHPELLLGAGALLIGPIASPLSLLSGFGGPAGEVRIPLWVVSELVTQIGVICFYAFTQQVFRPGVSWARAGIVLAAVTLPICLAGVAHGLAVAAPETLSAEATGGWLLACQFGYGGAFVWSAIEGLSHYVGARRRVAIGLIEPAVANRFLLFAIFGLACTVIAIANITAILLGHNIATSLLVLVPSAVFALVSSTAMFLAILPPAWYLEWLKASQPQAAGAR